MLGSPRALAILIIVAAVFVLSILGGALGEAFGLGFLSSSLPAIQLPAELITEVAGFKLMNTMVTTWLAMGVLIGLGIYLRARMSEVPGRLQALVELIVEFFLTLCESVAGKEKARRFFPLVFTIFAFIVIANWMGILPGFATVGRIADPEEIAHHHDVHEYHDPALTHDKKLENEKKDNGHHADEHHDKSHLDSVKLHVFSKLGAVNFLSPGSLKDELTFSEYEAKHGDVGENKRAGHLVPYLRSANTDVNTTLAMAIVAMVMVHFWGFSILGVRLHVGKFINFKEGPIGFFVGILELISELAKVVSFTFRLFGNIFAGEVLLMAMGFLLPMIGIIPFLGLELFVGVIQAFIFSMLTLVFASMASVSHGDNDHH